MNYMSYNQFERIYATAKDLVKATNYLFSITDGDSIFDEELYTDIILLHNKAVDFIVAMKELKNKEV